MDRRYGGRPKWRVVADMTAVGAGALIVGMLTGIVVFWLLGQPLGLDPEAPAGQLVFSLGTYSGLAAAGLLYLVRHELPLSYVRARLPSVRDIVATVVTLGLLGVLAIALPEVVDRLGLPLAEHGVADVIEVNPAVALAFVPLSILVVGPAEEFVYRGIIQTRLRERFDVVNAVAIASVVFAVVHVLAYLDPANPLGTLVTVVFLLLPLGAVLGAAYEYTENLVVVAVAHGVYNATVFMVSYADVVGMW
ncbi:Abi/CAAX domain protein [Natronomonas pharaonis DSM 2160]|uniref:Abi/CAAX domain protein n=1 Tax=Natronomonas pharaonis (strain ATCC 35678 / DSM 2160 / CIP 103997 / JCM 8858 / NBRC 14720 / NCIMB 2260 / Gabara) TaxID=348780 RepID=A0A1U7EZ87_NATPD|nr:type II CAAX endopeptidase family protein [Natronomonas pharaonis]CAI50586.1 Abi/CAAX domain protein [Natronomonas pharaonis DSM 2160]